MTPSLISNQDFFENYFEALLITRSDGTPVLANHAFAQLIGFTIEDIPVSTLSALSQLKNDSSSEINFIKKDNSAISVKISISKITLSDKSLGRVYTIANNSAMIDFKEKFAQQTAELMRSNEELEQFAYAASHDMQEPLRMITSYIQLIEKKIDQGDSTSVKEFMSYVVESVARMQSLLNDLLQFSRVNRKGSAFTTTDLNEVLQVAIAHLAEKIKETDAGVSFEKMPVLSCDSSQILRLFQNLLDNAIKYRAPGRKPVIQIFAEERGHEYVFGVKDNGIGIENKFYGRIFVIFQRLHSRTEYEGTGIGLAVCKKIVERHGGEIWVESEVGKGSTFYFTLKR